MSDIKHVVEFNLANELVTRYFESSKNIFHELLSTFNTIDVLKRESPEINKEINLKINNILDQIDDLKSYIEKIDIKVERTFTNSSNHFYQVTYQKITNQSAIFGNNRINHTKYFVSTLHINDYKSVWDFVDDVFKIHIHGTDNSKFHKFLLIPGIPDGQR